MNYRNERQHDDLLIKLATDLSVVARLDLLETAFGLPSLGTLETACRRRDFDVELTFSNSSLLIETKVDSDEGGRRDSEWQTQRIYRLTQSATRLKPIKYYLFVTYGTSEFFTKPYNRGPASASFRHLGLDLMIQLLHEVAQLSLPNSPLYRDWLRDMEREQRTRASAAELMAQFGTFRSAYLSLRDDVDFDRNRLLFCAPEMVFPVFGRLAELWNNNVNIRGDLGRVSVYPVARRSPTVVDSVLNFWELWDSGRPTFSARLPQVQANAYFEINEDLNLNMKLDEPGTPVSDGVILDVQYTLDNSYLAPIDAHLDAMTS